MNETHRFITNAKNQLMEAISHLEEKHPIERLYMVFQCLFNNDIQGPYYTFLTISKMEGAISVTNNHKNLRDLSMQKETWKVNPYEALVLPFIEIKIFIPFH